MNPSHAGRISAAVTVRDALVSDRGPVQRIAGTAMREFGVEPDFDHLDRELGCFGQAGPASLAQLVAESDGQVIGSLIVSWKDAHTLKLSAFYVDGGVRGKGTGRILLGEAIGRARQSGAAGIYLETWSSMTAAVHLYTSLGWQRGEKLAPESGAEWSYWLDLKR